MSGFVRIKANIKLFALDELKSPDLKDMLLAKTVSTKTVSVRSFITTPPFWSLDEFKVCRLLEQEARRCYEERCASIYQETIWSGTPSQWENFTSLTITKNNETSNVGALYFNCCKNISNDFSSCKKSFFMMILSSRECYLTHGNERALSFCQVVNQLKSIV